MTDTVMNLTPRQIGALVEAKLIEWAIPYEYVADFALADVQAIPSVQVRASEHIADADQVDQYAAHMKQGVTFPPIVILGDSILIDGNTRVAAARKAGIRSLPAFKCKFPNGELAVAFAAATNQMGGRRLTTEEAHAQANVLMRYGYEDDSIARELGYGRTQINNWRRERETHERAERTLVADKLPAISKTDQRKLAAIKQDAPFAAAVDAIASAKPKASIISDMVKRIIAAPSEADAISVVSAVRAEITPVGPPPHRATRTAEQVTAARVLPQLVKLQGRGLALVESDPERREAWVAQWATVRDLAAEVVGLHG